MKERTVGRKPIIIELTAAETAAKKALNKSIVDQFTLFTESLFRDTHHYEI